MQVVRNYGARYLVKFRIIVFSEKVQDIILFLVIPRNNVYFYVKSMIYWTYGV